MTEKEKKTPPYLREDQDRRCGKWQHLLLLLFILLLLSSGIAGYILGKRTEVFRGGQLIDTILLTPEAGEKPGEEAGTILHLTGHVMYTDGTPAANRTIELHSDPIRTVTDSVGNFLFYNVPLGEHSVSIINQDGSVAARRDILIDRHDAVEGISIGMNDDGSYVVELAVDIRMLEISIELGNETYLINPDAVTYETTDGMVVTPTGRASVQTGPIVTPAGNICLPDGTIVLPGGSVENRPAVILPDDTLVYPDVQLPVGEILISPDGTVNMPDGTVVKPGGEIMTPDGQILTPGNGGSIVTEEQVVPIGGISQNPTGDSHTENAGESLDSGSPSSQYESPEEPQTETLPVSPEQTEAAGGPSDNDLVRPGESPSSGDTVPPGSSGSGNQGGSGGNSGGNGGGNSDHGSNDSTESTRPTESVHPTESTNPTEGTEPTENTSPTEDTSPSESTEPTESTETEESSETAESTESSSPTETTEDPDKGTLDVEGQIKDSSEYISWKQLSEIDLFFNRDNPDSPIMPGSKGYYQFRLKNTRDEKLSIRLTISEKENHLPLYFKLTPLTGNRLSRQRNAVEGSLEGYHSTLELETEIDARAETDFRLEWSWPQEGHDEEDTKAGLKGGAYLLDLTITAEGAGK